MIPARATTAWTVVAAKPWSRIRTREAARLAGRGKLARHYLGERLMHKPGGTWGLRLERRIAAAAAPGRKDPGTHPTHRVPSREPSRSLA